MAVKDMPKPKMAFPCGNCEKRQTNCHKTCVAYQVARYQFLQRKKKCLAERYGEADFYEMAKRKADYKKRLKERLRKGKQHV